MRPITYSILLTLEINGTAKNYTKEALESER
jgi:hypothetical protein